MKTPPFPTSTPTPNHLIKEVFDPNSEVIAITLVFAMIAIVLTTILDWKRLGGK